MMKKFLAILALSLMPMVTACGAAPEKDGKPAEQQNEDPAADHTDVEASPTSGN